MPFLAYQQTDLFSAHGVYLCLQSDQESRPTRGFAGLDQTPRESTRRVVHKENTVTKSLPIFIVLVVVIIINPVKFYGFCLDDLKLGITV